ncbi:hypothetical protein [Streptomyces sp. NPDC001919]
MSHLGTVLITIALTVVFASLVAAAAGILARLDGATYPSAVQRAGTAFAAVLALAAAVTAAIAAVVQ